MSLQHRESPHVMIVDDDPSVRYTVQVVLENEGLPVITAPGGQACLDALARGFGGLILLDVMMPEMDGWETVRRIVDGGFADRVLICMLTAKMTPDDEMDPIKRHIVDYVTKPFSGAALANRVREYLEFMTALSTAA